MSCGLDKTYETYSVHCARVRSHFASLEKSIWEHRLLHSWLSCVSPTNEKDRTDPGQLLDETESLARSKEVITGVWARNTEEQVEWWKVMELAPQEREREERCSLSMEREKAEWRQEILLMEQWAVAFSVNWENELEF